MKHNKKAKVVSIKKKMEQSQKQDEDRAASKEERQKALYLLNNFIKNHLRELKNLDFLDEHENS